MKEEIGFLNYVIFPENNEIPFSQDHAFYRGVPSDRKFFLRSKITEDRYSFIADEYGILPDSGIAGRYGNGAIFVSEKNLPEEIIEWLKTTIPLPHLQRAKI